MQGQTALNVKLMGYLFEAVAKVSLYHTREAKNP